MVFVILKSFLFFMDNKITHWLVVSDFVLHILLIIVSQVLTTLLLVGTYNQ